MPKAPETKIPAALSHYTTLDGLIGVVNSGHLWGSNVSFLNDRKELSHGLEASVAAIKIVHSTKSYKQWHLTLDEVVEEFLSGIVPHTYALCLCTSSDLLSQWRGYGGAVQGVAITFDQKKLTSLLETQKALLCRVQYSNVLTKQKLGDKIRDALDDLNEKSPVLDAESRKKVARRVLSRLLPQFKHLGFREEREWRYVVQQATVRSDVCYRVRGNLIVPYIELGPGKGGALPIRSITVGPGKDQALTAKSIELFLNKTTYSGVPIRLSDVPYRV